MPVQAGSYGPGVPGAAWQYHYSGLTQHYSSPTESVPSAVVTQPEAGPGGPGAVTQASTITATGTKSAAGGMVGVYGDYAAGYSSGTAITQASTVTATGQADVSVTGTGTINQPSTVTATGSAARAGPATPTQGYGGYSGPSYGAGPAAAAAGTTARFGTGTTTQSSTSTASGSAPPPGGTITHPSTLSAAGTTSRFGSGTVTEPATIAGTGSGTGEGAGVGVGSVGVSPGNGLATYYAEPTYLPLPKRCRCRKGRPSKECEVHCHLIEERQHAEDELLVLALV